MQRKLLAIVISGAALVAGCSKPAEQNSTSATEPRSAEPVAVETAPAAPAEPTKGINGLITASPGAAGCDTPIEAKIAWNVASKPGVQEVEVFVGDGADAKLFAAGGASGEAATGPWVIAGTTFVVRNKADGTELDRLVIAGPSCTPPEQAPGPVTP